MSYGTDSGGAAPRARHDRASRRRARLQERLQTIQQTILSRTRLEGLIQDFNLYQEERTLRRDHAGRRRAVTSDIRVEPKRATSFIVGFVGRDRRQVQQVAEKLASFFIDESLKDGERRAENTSDFVESAVEEALRKLREVEEQVKKYRMQFASELPEQIASNQNAVQSIAAAAGHDHRVHRGGHEHAAARSSGGLPTSTPGPIRGRRTSAPAPGADITAAQRLEALQRELTNCKARGYSDAHQDVKRLSGRHQCGEERGRGEALRTPVGCWRRRLAGRADASPPPGRKSAGSLEDVKKRIAQQAAGREAVARLGVRVPGARRPGAVRAAEMVEMTREYEVLKKNYENMLNNREQANMSVNLERSQIGEQFTLLDQARVPERP